MKLRDLLAQVWVGSPAVRQIYYRMSGNRSLASLFLPDRLEEVEIEGGIGKGMKMRLNLRQERVYYFGGHELDVQSILPGMVRSGMRVYNIGAHIGFFALILSKMVGPTGQVIVFEPNPSVRERLIGNISLNDLNGRVRVEECALGDFDGDARFSTSLSSTQGRFEDLPYVKSGSSMNAHCKRFDTYVEEGGLIPDFILMDVEHAEGRVLKGMSRVMEKHRPIIIVEMHGEEAIKESWVELEKHNYLLATVPDFNVVNSLNDVTYGHYLAAHLSYFEHTFY